MAADPLSAALAASSALSVTGVADVRLWSDPAVSAASAQRVEWLIVDGRVAQEQPALVEVWQRERQAAGVTLQVFTLTAADDALARIGQWLSDAAQPVDAIHVLSHADAGQLLLGDGRIDTARLIAEADRLAEWARGLSPDADILLYGCRAGAGETGAEFVARLAAATGADVAASDDATGAPSDALAPADWVLERATGPIDTSAPLDLDALAQLPGTLSTFFVVNTLDSGPGSLRQALVDAGLMAGPDTIAFAIGTGPATITLASPLPLVNDRITLDGSTQPGYAGAPLVTLDGSGIGAGVGLELRGGASGSVIRGLALQGFAAGGILLNGVSGVRVESNAVVGTGGAGIAVTAGTGNALLANRLVGNAGLGIDLGAPGVTPNDGPGDADVGANELLNTPVLLSAAWHPDNGNLDIAGTLDGPLSATLRIDLYRVTAADVDPSGAGEASAWLGSLSVTTDASGRAAFATTLAGLSMAAGDRLSATATRVTGPATLGSTSELAGTLAWTPLGATIGPVQGSVGEDGRSATFTVALDRAPTADVTIPVVSSDSGEGVADVALLHFTPADWATPRTITVTGVDDALDDGDQALSIVLGPASSADPSFDGLTLAAVPLVNLDNDDTPRITSGGGGASAAYTQIEGTEWVATLTATDADVPAQTLHWSIAGGADAAAFALDPVSGALRFLTAPRLDTPADANADQVYQVDVQVDDGTGLLDTQSLSVRVVADTFLQGRALEMGVAPTGAFGSAVAAPSGFASAGQRLGAVSDPARDGWAQRDGDFIMPGTPLDTWGIQVGGTTLTNRTSSGEIAGQLVALGGLPETDGVLWTGNAAGLAIEQRITVTGTDLFAAVSFTLTNTSGADLSDVYVFRHVDPDNNFYTNGLFETSNSVVSQGDAGGVALVTASQPDGSQMALMGFGPNARVAFGNFGNVVPSQAWDGLNGNQPAGSVVSDVGITLVYRIPLLAQGASVTVDMRVLFAASPTPFVDLDADDSSAAGTDAAVGAWTEGGAAVTVVDADALISDTDSPTLAGLTATLLNPLDGAAERLAVQTQGTAITAQWDGQTLRLTGSDTAAAYQAVLRSLTYENSSEAPDTTPRQIRIVVDDGANASLAAIATVTLTAVNDAPVVAVNSGLAIVENAVGQLIGPAQLLTTDLDQNAAGLVYTLSSAPAHGQLTLSGQVLTAGGSFTQADIDAGRLAYSHDGSETVADAIDLVVADGQGASRTLRVDVGIAPVDDQPPQIVSEGAAASVVRSVPENALVIGTVQTADGDVPASPVSVRIVGPDAARVEIDPQTGALRWRQAPDHEAPQDSDGDNVYRFSLVPNDGLRDGTAQDWTLTVTNVDEAPVVSAAVWSVAQGGSTVLGAAELTVSDVDTPASALRWTVQAAQGVRLERSSDPTQPLVAFTQQDLLDGTVRVVHDGITAAPSLSLVLTDGTTAGAPLAMALNVVPMPVSLHLSLDAADAVVDGSFEQGDPAWRGNSWTSPAGYRIGPDPAWAAAGRWAVAVEGDPTPDPTSRVEQTLDTVPGQAYVLSLQALSRLGIGSGDMAALTLDGVERLRFGTTDQWQTVSLAFVATGARTTIGVVSLGSVSGPAAQPNDGIGVVIDDVQLHRVDTALAVQEDAPAVPLAPGARLSLSPSAGAGATGLTLTLGRLGGAQGDDRFEATGSLGALVGGATLTLGGTVVGQVERNDGGLLVLRLADGLAASQIDGVLQQIGYRQASQQPPAGLVLRWTLSAQTAGGATVTTSADQQVAVTALDDAPTGLPQVIGTARQGETLVADTRGLADPDGLGPLSLQWLRDGQPVAGATGPQLLLDNADVGHVFSLRVSTVDGGGTAWSLTSAPTAAVADVNDAPTIVAPATGATLDVPENSVAVATVIAADPDPTPQDLRFALSGGADQALFEVDAASGALRFRVAPDAERPADADADGTYEVQVSVSDAGGASAAVALRVRVTDVNEAPTLSLPTEVLLPAWAADGTTVLVVEAQDPDAGQALRYRIVGDDSGALQIDAVTGVLSLADGRRLDARLQPAIGVVVAVDDGAGATVEQRVAIRLIAAPSIPTTTRDTTADPSIPDATVPVATTAAPSPDGASSPGGAGVGVPAGAGADTAGAGPAAGGNAEASDRRQRLLGLRGAGPDSAESVSTRSTGLIARDDAPHRSRGDEAADDPVTTEGRPFAGVPAGFALTRALLTGPLGETSTEGLAVRLEDLVGRGWGLGRRAGGAGADDAAAVDEGGGATASGAERFRGLLLEITQPDRVAGVSLTAGFVWWLTRGGGALASVLMAVPAWRQIDLLPVMARQDDEEDEDEEAAAAEALFEPGSDRRP